MKEAGFQDKGVYTFEGFLEAVKEKSQIIDEQLVTEEIETSISKEDSSTTQNKEQENSDYLFKLADAKELATGKDIRTGKIVNLQEKIKNTLRELRNRFKPEALRESEENINDGPSMD